MQTTTKVLEPEFLRKGITLSPHPFPGQIPLHNHTRSTAEKQIVYLIITLTFKRKVRYENLLYYVHNIVFFMLIY